jgi:hypothetical protein
MRGWHGTLCSRVTGLVRVPALLLSCVIYLVQRSPGGAAEFGAERQFSARAEMPRKVTPAPNMRITAIAARALGGRVDMIPTPSFPYDYL